MPPNPKLPNETLAELKSKGLYWVQRVFGVVFIPLRFLLKCMQWIFLRLFTSLQRARRNDRILAVFLLFIWVAIIFGNFFLRGSQTFEGNLVVTEMSFAYAGDREKLFLNTINSIKNLDIQGSQTQPLTLTGKFSSSEPSLNQKLSRLNKGSASK